MRGRLTASDPLRPRHPAAVLRRAERPRHRRARRASPRTRAPARQAARRWSPAASATICTRFGVPCCDIERLTADRAGRAEDRDAESIAHLDTSAQEHVVGDDGNEDETVETVEEASVTGQQRAGVLDARLTLEARFEEIAERLPRRDSDDRPASEPRQETRRRRQNQPSPIQTSIVPAAPAAKPSHDLFGEIVGSHLVLADGRADEVGEDIVGPHAQQRGEGEQRTRVELAVISTKWQSMKPTYIAPNTVTAVSAVLTRRKATCHRSEATSRAVDDRSEAGQSRRALQRSASRRRPRCRRSRSAAGARGGSSRRTPRRRASRRSRHDDAEPESSPPEEDRAEHDAAYTTAAVTRTASEARGSGLRRVGRLISAPEASRASLVVDDGRRAASSRSKSGHRTSCDLELRVGDLPQQEVGDAHLPARADDQVGIGQPGGVEMRARTSSSSICARVDSAPARDAGGDRADGVDDLGAAAVVERDHAASARRCRRALLATREGRRASSRGDRRAGRDDHTRTPRSWRLVELALEHLDEQVHQPETSSAGGSSSRSENE